MIRVADRQAGKGTGSEALAAFESALCDDLNTPEALGALAPLLTDMNELLHTRKVGNHSQLSCLHDHAAHATAF